MKSFEMKFDGDLDGDGIEPDEEPPEGDGDNGW